MARTVRIEVVGDNRSLKAALADSERSLARLGDSAAKSQSSLARLESGFDFASKGGAAALGVGAIVTALSSLTSAASEAQQASGGMQAVFKDQATAMQQAADSATNLGLSTSQYMTFATRLGGQLKNAGIEDFTGQTQELIELATDLVATYGGTVPDAISALGAAFRGEFDPLEQWNVNIKQSEVTARAAADGITETEAKLSLIREKSIDAQGRWAASQDKFATKQAKAVAALENTKAALGEGLLPYLTTGAQLTEDFAKAFSNIPTGFVTVAAGVAGFVFAIKGLRAATALSIAELGKLQAALTLFAARSGSTGYLAGALGSVAATKLASALPMLTAALGVAAGAFLVYQQSQQNAEAAGQALAGNIDELTGKFDELGRKKIGEEFLRNFSAEDLENTPFKLQEIVDAVAEGGPKFAEFEQRVDAWVEAQKTGLQALKPGYVDWLQALQNSVNSAGQDADRARIIADTSNKAADAAAKSGDAAAKAAPSVGELADRYDELAKAVNDALDPLLKMAGIAIGADDALADVAQAIADARDAAKDTGNVYSDAANGIDLTRQKGRDAQKALSDLANSALDASGSIALEKGTGAAVQNMKEARSAFIDVAKSMGFPQDEAKKLADRYGLIPGDVKTLIKISGADTVKQQASEIGALIRNIPTAWNVVIRATTIADSVARSLFGGGGGQRRAAIPAPEEVMPSLMSEEGPQQRITSALFAAASGAGRSPFGPDLVIKVKWDSDLKEWVEDAETVDRWLEKRNEQRDKQNQYYEDFINAQKDVLAAEKELRKAKNDDDRKSAKRALKDARDARKEAYWLAVDRTALANDFPRTGPTAKLWKEAVKDARYFEGLNDRAQRDDEKRIDAARRRSRIELQTFEARKRAAADDIAAQEKQIADRNALAIKLGGAAPITQLSAVISQNEDLKKQIAKKIEERTANAWNPERVKEINKEIDDLTAKVKTPAQTLADWSANVNAFASNLKKLKAAGLSAEILKQVADLGPEAGNAVAGALLDGGDQAIAQTVAQWNATAAQLTIITRDAAQQIIGAQGDVLYAGVYGALVKAFDTAGAALEADKKWYADTFEAPVYTGTLRGMKKAIKEALAFGFELPLYIPKKGKQSASSSSLTVNVQGNLVDPAGAAIAIRQALSDQRAREGAVAW